MNIHILNGPNLNWLGKREPHLYGEMSFDDFLEKKLRPAFQDIALTYFQSNIEGEIIDNLQFQSQKADAIVINPGGYSHTSIAIADCIAALTCPVVEVHITNIHARREEQRHNSLTGAKCKGVISGFGLESYAMAMAYLIDFR
ncbi:MAG: 3-dehydroquinate dehydratase [Flavobacteriales bacterium]|jgi:3-dehydroquinate dehydratase-2|nr:3-dehydroquinate dehydratase [Flavobacteriales bacterium]